MKNKLNALQQLNEGKILEIYCHTKINILDL
jgi:hypothetical protein